MATGPLRSVFRTESTNDYEALWLQVCICETFSCRPAEGEMQGGGPAEETSQDGWDSGPGGEVTRCEGGRGRRELRETLQQQERRGGVATQGEQGQAKSRDRVGASERRKGGARQAEEGPRAGGRF